MYNSDTRTITIRTVPSDVVAFRITDRDGNPVYGANVILCTKGIIPTSHKRVTDLAGIVQFSAYELVHELPPETIKEIPWLFMADIPDSEYAYWKDDVKFETGVLHIIKLKKYKEVPTFWIKFELKDVIGRDLFASVLTQIESWILGWAGFEITEIKGAGTKTVTIYFKPPWHSSPFVFTLTATTGFILALIIFFGGIILLLIVAKWTFGELAAAVGLGGIALLIIGLLLVAKPVVKKITPAIEARIRREKG